MPLITAGSRHAFHLDGWLVQPAQCRVSKDGQTVQVRPKVMDLLTFFAAHRGEVVFKDQLLNGVWGTEAVSESTLTRTVTELRLALGDHADSPRVLETIPKRGYRLIASVSAADEDAGSRSLPSARAAATGWLSFGGVAIALVGTLMISPRVRARPSTPVRIAVLPFEQLPHDPLRQHLADGLADDTIVSLGTTDPAQLVVVGRTSVLRFRSTTTAVREIGRELAVDYLVEGLIRVEGQRLRLTSKLIRVGDEAAIWSQSYEGDLTSVLGLQREISGAIAEQIRGRISAAEARDDDRKRRARGPAE